MRLAAIIAALLLTSTARADRDPDFESGLVEVAVQGEQVMPGPQYARNQLVYKDTTTAKTVGTIAAVGGGLSLVTGWVFYVARANYRLQPRLELGDSISKWETLGHWSASLVGFGAANLVVPAYTNLSGASVPVLAWIGGVAGVAAAAVGLGFAAGGTHCAPIALVPGSSFPTACVAGTSDALFGPLLIGTSLPLLNLPLSYALRGLFAGRPDSLTLGPSGLRYSGVF